MRNEENIAICRLIEEIYLKYPFCGSRKMAREITRRGTRVNRKRIQNLMRKMGIAGIAPGPDTGKPHLENMACPYLLKDITADHPNHAWSTDITYLPTRFGFMYLSAIVDWYSRRILSCRLSSTLESSFCTGALEEALDKFGTPEIFSSDQGSQFTPDAFIGTLLARGVRIGMDSRGRAFDNVCTERVWRSITYEWLFINSSGTIEKMRSSLTSYILYYNSQRIHEALKYRTPDEVYNLKVS